MKRLPGRRRLRVPVAWDLGLGRELGNVFWAMIGVEAAFGAYVGIWPLWIEALGAPITVVGLVLGSSGLLRLLTLAPSAALADRVDPRTLIVAARSLTAIGMVAAAFATHWTMLAPMVIGSAIGEIAFPLTQAHLAAHAGEQRVRAFSLVFNVGPAIAFGISPLISGALIAQFDMRAAFIFAAVCTAFSLYFFSRFTPRPKVAKEDEPTRSSYREALAEPGVKPLLGMQFATIFSLALGYRRRSLPSWAGSVPLGRSSSAWPSPAASGCSGTRWRGSLSLSAWSWAPWRWSSPPISSG